MYYIVNQNHRIIAADSSLLNLLNVKDIDELYTKMTLGDIIFSSPIEEKITISIDATKESFSVHHHTLTSVLGEMILVEISLEDQNDITENIQEETSLLVIGTSEEDTLSTMTTIPEEANEIHTIDNDIISEPLEENIEDLQDTHNEKEELEDTLSLLDDTPTSFDIHTDETSNEEEIALLDDTSSPFKIDETIEEKSEDTNTEEEISLLAPTVPMEENITEDSHALLDLTLADTADDTIHEIIDTPSTTIDEAITFKENVQSTDPIVIDIETISQQIGISTDDYNNFLNEYIDTTLTLEKDLQSEDDKKYSHAIDTLSHLSSVLHLPMITQIIAKIKTASPDTKPDYIASLYDTLARLTTTQVTTEQQESSIENIPDTQGSFIKEESVDENINDSQMLSGEGFGKIDLNTIEPIHFDFQMEEAANDLSLPVELIEEFVHDFIEQAHTETEKMLLAYEKGDLDAIQKIGHMLKGASSNLRINALSDTLYKIQFCEDGSQLEDFIKDYWGHFLSFETQINLTSK
jgi:HPt (histidine-containing phosphotransfer) domain-containing protein